MDWSGLPWVDSLISGSQKARTRLKNKILDGIKYHNAKWRTIRKNVKDKSKPQYELSKLDKRAKEFYDFLKSSDVEFVGFSPIIPYIKEKGSKKDLKAYWNHKHGTPGLLYKHKDLPLLLIASPALRFNESLLNEIDANAKLHVQLKGISS